jgi:integrase
LETIIAHLPDWLQDFTRFAFFTGMRKGEIASLKWTDVDRDAGAVQLRAEAAKTGEARTLMLVGDLTDLFERRWQARSFTRVAGVPGLLLHDLRRTFARNADRAGVSRSVARAMGGWKTEATWQRYRIVAEEELREAAQRLQFYVDTLPVSRWRCKDEDDLEDTGPRCGSQRPRPWNPMVS